MKYCKQRNFMSARLGNIRSDIRDLAHKAGRAPDCSMRQTALIAEIKREKERLESNRAALAQHDVTCSECIAIEAEVIERESSEA